VLDASQDAIELKSRGLRISDNDVAGSAISNSPGRYCSPHHRMTFYSRDEDSKRVSSTWWALSIRPYPLMASYRTSSLSLSLSLLLLSEEEDFLDFFLDFLLFFAFFSFFFLQQGHSSSQFV